MSKIFRLYKGGTNTYQGWNNSPAFPYNSANRDTIEDPDGASSRHEITSIPSPFARIDLIKTAFKEVCKINKKTQLFNLDGNTVFHKMVSDALDVGEIFFNIDKYKDKVEIITWNAAKMISELMLDGNLSHCCLADALDKYFKSDSKVYNFGEVRNIYLLNYIDGPDELNIIGATSPATLFFSSANELSYVKNMYFDEDRPFDEDFQPLYKRDFEYIKMWFTLRKTIPNFSTLFPEIETYLNQTYQKIADSAQRNELQNLDVANLNELEIIDVVGNQENNTVEVLGFNLFKKLHKVVSKTSEFTIKATVDIKALLPLVLPIEAGNKYSDLVYTTGKWGISNVALFKDIEKDLTKRSLPFDGSFNPYITISDLLEETLIRIPHTLNVSNYYSGNIILDSPKLSYLIPLKPLFFNYFTVEDLLSGMSNGLQFIELNSLAGGSVKVILRIPIKGNEKVSYIEYSRIYYNDRQPNISENEGGIVQFDFDGHIMPLIKFNNPSDDAFYSISCVSTCSRKYNFDFFDGTLKVQDVISSCRNEDEAYKYKSINYIVQNSNFSFIQVSDKNQCKGLIIPLFKKQKSINSFEFAVDLGTSNTHIEYRIQNEVKPKAFDIKSQDTLACQFFKPSFIMNQQDDLIDEVALIEKDFVPLEVGENDFKFPTRTTLSCAKMIDWTNNQHPYSLFNIPLTYDKRNDIVYNNIRYNIKWGVGDDQYAMEGYVDCLMLMLRNKVLLNEGDLRKTKVTWFYPISMASKRIQKLKATWDTSYNKYFSGNSVTNSLNESVAPIVYYFSRYATATNLINIDMGGGTTDIAFAKNKEVLFVTSFKYATNVLFENTFSELDTNNGIVDFHKNSILNLLQEKTANELVAIFKSSNNSLPANMASFLFSLKENSLIKKAGINDKVVDFNSLLRDDENFKIVFILHYVAIIYHVAHIVKNKGITEPRHIAFSGNGSKIVNILTTDTKLLAKFTRLIFEKVLERPYSGELEILGLDKDSDPKESTCKGGIIGTQNITSIDSPVILKADNKGFVESNITYLDLDLNYKKQVIQSVSKFFDFTFETLDKAIDFDNCFGVTKESIEIARTVCQKDLMTYLDKGIAQRLDESNGKNKIEETVFFYPIKGVINAISQEIYQNLQRL